LRAQLIAGKTTSLNGALLTASEDPILLGSGGEIDKARFGMSWIGEAHAVPIMEQRELVDGFVKTILTPLLAARGLTTGKLAVDQANISFIQSMQAHFPDLELVDGDTVMQQARWIKTDLEIAVIVMSVVLAFAGFAAVAYFFGGDARRAEGAERRFAGVRDLNSFFRYAAQDENGAANPVAGKISHAISTGEPLHRSGDRGLLPLLLAFEVQTPAH